MENQLVEEGIRFHLKGCLGLTLAKCLPGRRHVVEKYATIPSHYKQGFGAVDRLIRQGLFYQKYLMKDPQARDQQLSELHKQFWSNQSSEEYYASTQTRFAKVFVPHFSHYLDQLEPLLQKAEVETVCEIGVGDGQLLQLLSQRWPDKRCVGIDLSTDQIEKNKENFAGESLEFYAGDAGDWIAEQAGSGVLFVTGLGVLEYFTRDALDRLLANISAGSRNVLFFTEPVDDAAQMGTGFESFPAGREHSFSHDYPALLERAGWRLSVSEHQPVSGYRYWVVIAATEAG